jgi:ElaB/YqjD/DUF883 family membrane-anchored ribosome-binding protein
MANTTATATKRRNGKTQPTPAEVETQISKLRSDISSLASSVAEYGSQTLESAKSQAGALSHDAAAASETALAELRNQLDAIESDLRSRVREKPLQAIGIAAGLGFLIALMMRR